MSELIIKNAAVCDPLNGINCEKMDIAVKDGKIVESVSSNADTIDAKGKLTMAGAIDGHTHCAGKINVGRLMSPHDMRMNPVNGLSGIQPATSVTRAQAGYNTPNTFALGYRYSKLGYTTLSEAAISMMAAKHTHEEFESIPILDKWGLTLFGNNWHVMNYVRDEEPEKLAAYLAWGLKATRGFGIKVVNPGGGEAWGWGKNVTSIDDEVPDFDVTPREILVELAKANEDLNLPHSIHVHCNNLGKPGNYETTLDTMKIMEGIKASRDRQVLHLAHLQFHAYAGNSWREFESASTQLADYINTKDHLTFDMGQVIFGPAMTMTADGPLEYSNARMLHSKWSNKDVELEDGAGVVPIVYSPKSFVNSVQWAIGLELALLVDDPWKVMFTTDSPNGGSFVNYPEAYSLLMSAKKREQIIETLPELAIDRMVLPGIDRELSFYELAVMTRALQSKMFSVDTIGHLGIGANADIAIYDIIPDKIDAGTEHEKVKQALSATSYTIKSGNVVVQDGEIVSSPRGKTYWVNASGRVPSEINEVTLKDIQNNFRKYYTVAMSNYVVDDHYLPNPIEINTQEA